MARISSCARAKQRVGGDQCVDLSEGLASEGLGLRGQAAALRVRESQTLGRELFPKDAVLFLEIVDDVALLLLIQPAMATTMNSSVCGNWCTPAEGSRRGV